MKDREERVSGVRSLWDQLRDRFGYHVVATNALALLFLSWIPGVHMIRTGILSGHAEHVIAYGLSGVLTVAMLAERHAAWWIAAALVAYSFILELGQMFVPGRHAAFEDFFFSSAGAAVGVIACAMLRWLVTLRGLRE